MLEGVPSGTVNVTAWAREHASRELEVDIPSDSEPLEIGLSAGGTIAGHLVAADGATPVAGHVMLSHLEHDVGHSILVEANGRFAFQHLAPGRYGLGAFAEGRRAVERSIVLGKDEHLDGIELELESGGGHDIRGRITGLVSADLQHVMVSARRLDATVGEPMSAAADAEGAYVLRGVKPGPVRVYAEFWREIPGGGRNERSTVRTVEMPADSDLAVDLHFPTGARLTGRVTQSGKPLGEVPVRPRPTSKQDVQVYEVATSAAGEYVIEGMPPGEYRLQVGDYRTPPIQVAGDMRFDIEVPAPQLTGAVLEENGRMPIVDAQVEVWPVESTGPRIRLDGRTDHLGRFDLTGLEPGEFTLLDLQARLRDVSRAPVLAVSRER